MAMRAEADKPRHEGGMAFGNQAGLDSLVDAALDALMEPTELVIRAGRDEHVERESFDRTRLRFIAMICAIKEGH